MANRTDSKLRKSGKRDNMLFHRLSPEPLRGTMDCARSWIVPGVLGCLLLLLPGCGGTDPKRPELHPAVGTLTINGQPATGARLILHPADPGSLDERGALPSARVGADGRFELTTYQAGDGAPIGSYRVGIIWMSDETSSSAWDRLGGAYANPERTRLTIEIREGQNDIEPIQLTGVRFRPRPRPDPRLSYE